MTALLRHLAGHQTASRILMLLTLAAGLYAAPRINSQIYPDMPVEALNVSFTWTGAGAVDMDTAIVTRVEPKLRELASVVRTTSIAQDGYGSVTLELAPGVPIGAVSNEVAEAVRSIRDLPTAVEGPVIERKAWRETVAGVVLSGDVERRELALLAETLRERLREHGLTRTTLKGLPSAEISVEVRPETLPRFGLTIGDIAEAIRAETGVKAIGEAGNDGMRLATATRPLTVAAIKGIPLRIADGTARLTVADVAMVTEDAPAKGVLHYSNGKPAVIIELERGQAGDIIESHRKLEEVLQRFRPDLPAGVEATIVKARAGIIGNLVTVLVKNAIFGAGLVLAVLLVFLRARVAIAVTLGVITATAGTLVLMYLCGVTYNLVSLFALTLCLGMLVDDGVIISEHAERLWQRGSTPGEAALEGATRMAAPVLAAVATTIIAFGSLAFIDGRFGNLVIDLPFVVTIILCASLLEAFFILPGHLTHALSHSPRTAKASKRIGPMRFDGSRFGSQFERLIMMCIAARYVVIAAAILAVSYAFVACIDGTLGWRFFDAGERPTITADVAMLDGARRSDTEAMVAELERSLLVVSERYRVHAGASPVVAAVATVGDLPGSNIDDAETRLEDQLGGLEIELLPTERRTYSTDRLLADWRKEIREHPLLDTVSFKRASLAADTPAIEIEMSGKDAESLRTAAESLIAELSQHQELRDVRNDIAYGRPGYSASLKAKGRSMGFDSDAIAESLRQRLDGVDAAHGSVDGRDLAVVVRGAEEPGSAVQDILLEAPDGRMERLDAVAHLVAAPTVVRVSRANGSMSVSVTASTANGLAVSNDLLAELETKLLPALATAHRIDAKLVGATQEERTFLSGSARAIIGTIVAMYLILAWSFRSWSLPVVVLLVLPVGFAGSIFGHWVHDAPLGLMSIVGGIGLSGILVNNAIVLVSESKAPGRPQGVSAIAEATRERARAIFLTTMTTIIALAPLLADATREVSFLKPAVISIVYGLGCGAAIAMLLVPALLAVHDELVVRGSGQGNRKVSMPPPGRDNSSPTALSS